MCDRVQTYVDYITKIHSSDCADMLNKKLIFCMFTLNVRKNARVNPK